MTDEKKYIGQRVWFSDGAVYTGAWEDMPDDGVLVRILYYSDGNKQIQEGVDYYYEAPHHSGEMIRGCGMKKDGIKERYPGAIIKKGIWAPDKYHDKIKAEAMASTWNSNGD